MRKVPPCLLTLGMGIFFILLAAAPGAAEPLPASIPMPNTVTLVDLGASTCKICKMMAPFLEELKEEYQGRADVVFIDLRKHSEKAKEFGVSIMPTQIFYDRTGQERSRHVGFMDKPFMASILDKLLNEEETVPATP